jgi:hypothetical protein
VTKYREGQRVRIEWPNGSAVEGVVEFRYDDPSIAIGEVAPTWWVVDTETREVVDNRVVTILPAREPLGLGAVVEASWRDRPRELFIRARRESYQWRPEKEYATTNLYVPWSDLIDPVVLSEGWVES